MLLVGLSYYPIVEMTAQSTALLELAIYDSGFIDGLAVLDCQQTATQVKFSCVASALDKWENVTKIKIGEINLPSCVSNVVICHGKSIVFNVIQLKNSKDL